MSELSTDEAIEEWQELLSNGEEIDPSEKHQWESLCYGFFLGKGVDVDEAGTLARRWDTL